MSEVVDRLSEGSHIAEWIDPYDQRLVSFSGRKPPVDAGSFRTCWDVVDAAEEQIVAQEVGRLLLPESARLRGQVAIKFTNLLFDAEDMGEGLGNVVIQLSDQQDWADHFPTDRAIIFKRNDGRLAWGAIGLTDNDFGLAVFSQQLADGGVQARIQVVPDDVLQRILAAEDC